MGKEHKSGWLGPRLFDQLASAVRPLTSTAVPRVCAGAARGNAEGEGEAYEGEASALEAQRSEFSRCEELSQGWGVGRGWAVSSKVGPVLASGCRVVSCGSLGGVEAAA